MITAILIFLVLTVISGLTLFVLAHFAKSLLRFYLRLTLSIVCFVLMSVLLFFLPFINIVCPILALCVFSVAFLISIVMMLLAKKERRI